MILLRCIEMYCISPIWYYYGVLRSIEMCKPNMILLRCIEMLIEKVATALRMDEAAKIVLSLTHSNWHSLLRGRWWCFFILYVLLLSKSQEQIFNIWYFCSFFHLVVEKLFLATSNTGPATFHAILNVLK